MFDIKFKINGRTVRPNQITNELEKAMLQEISNSIKKAVSSVRCPTHGEAAQILGTGRTIDKLKFEVTGCCDELISEVRRRLQ